MKTNKELNDPDVATNSLASPQTSPEKQAQCGFSCSFSHSSQLLSSHRKLMNNGLRCAGVPPGTVSHHNTGSNTPSGCPCCFFSTFGHIYFHCVWCCTALFIYEGHLILLSDWVKSKQASFQSLLFLFISVSPAAERLRYILGDDEETMPTPTLFTEMDTLQYEGDELEWRESAR